MLGADTEEEYLKELIEIGTEEYVKKLVEMKDCVKKIWNVNMTLKDFTDKIEKIYPNGKLGKFMLTTVMSQLVIDGSIKMEELRMKTLEWSTFNCLKK